MSQTHSRIAAAVPTDLATITRDVGSLLLMQALLMSVSVLVALVFGEYRAALAFLLSGGVTAAIGTGARRTFADAPAPKMKHGMVIAAGGWFMTAVFGALPFLLTAYFTPVSAMDAFVRIDVTESQMAHVYGWTSESSLLYFRDPIHAFFESMSGWTGSGLTMAVAEPTLPRSIQWWRSLIQYIGGVGVIVLTVSILARPGSGSYALYRSEARERKIHPSIVSTVRTVWKIFVGYTLLAIAALFVAIWISEDLPLFETAWQALNHAMTGLATGGFSVTDNSIATYDSPLIETVLLPFMTIGAIAFPIHYAVLGDRNYREFVNDLQTKWLFVLLAIGIVVLTVQNLATFDFALSFRDSTFQWVSALSCTGFQSSPIGAWSRGGKVILAVAMIIGGAAGSTVGGIKIIRAYTIARGIRWQFARVFLPANAVVTAKIGDRVLNRSEMEREFSEAAIVSLLWLLLLLAGTLVLANVTAAEFGLADVFFEVASAQGNVGLSTGITGPDMSPVAELTLVANMWIGRLEIIPVLVLLRSALYGLNP